MSTLNEFIKLKVQIDAQIKELQALSHDHFDIDPEDATQGEVSELDMLKATLQDVLDRFNGEGEYK